MLSKIKRWLRRWLEIDTRASEKDVAKLRGLVNDRSDKLEALQKLVYDQIETIGIDVHWHKPAQSQIIIVSRLGSPTGSIHTKNVYFRDYRELVDFVKTIDQAFNEERAIIDTIPEMSRDLAEQRRRHR